MQEMIVQQKAPYPMPEGLRQNPYTARILMESYSGAQSEFTAINQYIYHHMEITAAEVSKTLKSIAIVEMRHLDMLGTVIRQLGVPPKFIAGRQNRRIPWTAGFIKYGTRPREMLTLDIEGEYAAVRGYERTLRQISDMQIQALIRRIMQDELLHIKCLEQLAHML